MNSNHLVQFFKFGRATFCHMRFVEQSPDSVVWSIGAQKPATTERNWTNRLMFCFVVVCRISFLLTYEPNVENVHNKIPYVTYSQWKTFGIFWIVWICALISHSNTHISLLWTRKKIVYVLPMLRITTQRTRMSDYRLHSQKNIWANI